MNNKYTALNRYRLSRKMSMAAFAKELGLSIDIVRRTLYGISQPHDYNKEVIDKYYKTNQTEILDSILDA